MNNKYDLKFETTFGAFHLACVYLWTLLLEQSVMNRPLLGSIFAIKRATRTFIVHTVACFIIMLAPKTLNAQTIYLVCGANAWGLDTDSSTISTPYVDNEQVTWNYDGDWIRWTDLSGSSFGVNVNNGYFISNGVSSDEACVVENRDAIAQIAIDETALLRLAFIELSEAERKEIQEALTTLGAYSSTIDGLWGKGTKSALLIGVETLEANLDRDFDISTLDGSREIIATFFNGEFAQYGYGEGDECDGCDMVANASQPGSQLETFKNLNPQCKALPKSSLVGARAEAWSGSPNGMQIMSMLDETFDRFSSNDEVIFQQYLDIAARNPNFVPLQWTIGYGYWKRNDFENAVTWLSKASAQGEPNSAYLLSTLALNVVSDQDSLQLDSSFPNGPLDLQLAIECLTVAAETNETLIVSGRQHQTYFAPAAAAILASLYLHEGSFLYPEAFAAQINWSKVPKSPELALQMLQVYRQQPMIRRDVDYENEIEALANDLIAAKQGETVGAKALNDQISLTTMKYSVSEMREVQLKCAGYTSLKSLCWGLSGIEMARVLATEGFVCVDSPHPWSDALSMRCVNGEHEIGFNEQTITLGCSVVSTCNYYGEEVARMMVESDIISNIEVSPRGQILEYCGRGIKSERVCILQVPDIRFHLIRFERGAASDPEPSFN